jgi:Transglycosylase SLT domain
MSSFAVRVSAVIIVAVLAGLGAMLVLDRDPAGPPKLVPGSGHAPGSDEETVDPLAYTPQREAELTAAATRGYAHVIYAKSPGGARASAARVARYRSITETVGEESGIDPDTLEAMILLESAGRADATADPQLEGAVGLGQILAETGRNLLKMQIDTAAARRISRSIARAMRQGKAALVERLRERRRHVDERFDPAKSIAAMARYLVFARGTLGRDDLAIASYHMGVGNLQNVLSLYGDSDASYTRLYFDSTPLRNPRTYAKLASLGDDSSTYLWRVLAAKQIMRLYRDDPARLDRISALQTAKNSAEEVLHPGDSTERFATPDALRSAYRDGRIRALPRALLARYGLAIDPGMGQLAPRLQRPTRTYRGLRPDALALLVYLGAGVKAISGQQPLIVTSTVRDERYQRLLIAANIEATRNYSLHTTGWAFDIMRSYRSRAQGQAFEFMLERLQSLDLIAWVREPAAIHVTVSSRAKALAGLVRRRR